MRVRSDCTSSGRVLLLWPGSEDAGVQFSIGVCRNRLLNRGLGGLDYAIIARYLCEVHHARAPFEGPGPYSETLILRLQMLCRF